MHVTLYWCICFLFHTKASIWMCRPSYQKLYVMLPIGVDATVYYLNIVTIGCQWETRLQRGIQSLVHPSTWCFNLSPFMLGRNVIGHGRLQLHELPRTGTVPLRWNDDALCTRECILIMGKLVPFCYSYCCYCYLILLRFLRLHSLVTFNLHAYICSLKVHFSSLANLNCATHVNKLLVVRTRLQLIFVW